jgi:hypothetical protein
MFKFLKDILSKFEPKAVNPIPHVDPQPVVFKRKFRWTLEGDFPAAKFGPLFCRVTARPIPTEPQKLLPFADFSTITTTFWDDGQSMEPFYKVIQSMYRFDGVKTEEITEEQRLALLGTLELKLYDGCANLIESWTLSKAWPQAINWGELSCDPHDVAEIETTWRYNEAKYQNYTPQYYVAAPNTNMGIGTLGSLGMNPNIIF